MTFYDVNNTKFEEMRGFVRWCVKTKTKLAFAKTHMFRLPLVRRMKKTILDDLSLGAEQENPPPEVVFDFVDQKHNEAENMVEEKTSKHGHQPKCPGCRQVPTREELADPSVWGRAWWTSMIATAYAYSENPTPEEREKYALYFNTIASVLPCPKCRRHFSELLKEHPVEPHLDSGAKLRKWIVERKNDVNRRLGKDCPTMQHVCKTWNQKLYRKRAKTATVVGLTVGVVALCVLLAVIFYWLGSRSKSRSKESDRPLRDSQFERSRRIVMESESPISRPFDERAASSRSVRKPLTRSNVPTKRSRPLVESYVPTSP